MGAVLGTDVVVTGHSLGRNKLDHLLKSGVCVRICVCICVHVYAVCARARACARITVSPSGHWTCTGCCGARSAVFNRCRPVIPHTLFYAGAMARAEIEENYAISRRIEAEERCLDNALMVFTSTQQVRVGAGRVAARLNSAALNPPDQCCPPMSACGGQEGLHLPILTQSLPPFSYCRHLIQYNTRRKLHNICAPLRFPPPPPPPPSYHSFLLNPTPPHPTTTRPHPYPHPHGPSTPPPYPPPPPMQEIDEQWGLYDGYHPDLARILRFRRSQGRHMPLVKVIPPGLEISNLKASAGDVCVCARARARVCVSTCMYVGGGGGCRRVREWVGWAPPSDIEAFAIFISPAPALFCLGWSGGKGGLLGHRSAGCSSK
jgi:hypothetical protein